MTPRPEWIKSSLAFNEAEQLNAFGLKADKVHLTYFQGRVEVGGMRELFLLIIAEEGVDGTVWHEERSDQSIR